tara:strand:- start:19 stop:342 length:324 start_codon:yes stop_codon:yes gene_type:complete
MKNLVFLLLCVSSLAYSQIQVIHFNANWNAANDVKWVEDLSDCKTKKIDIATDTDAATKYEIVVVPTIVIFNDGEEVKRYQADISFAMKATKDEVQEMIDEIMMDSF